MKSVSLLNARTGSLVVRAQGDERFFAKHVGEPLVDADALCRGPDRCRRWQLAREAGPRSSRRARREAPRSSRSRSRAARSASSSSPTRRTAAGGIDDFTVGGRARREPLREPGRDRPRERPPPPRGGREGEDGARDRARGLDPEDDSPRVAPGRPRPPPRGPQPPDEAGRRRLLRRLPAAGRSHGLLRGGRVGQGRPRGPPRLDGPRVPPPARPRPGRPTSRASSPG